MEEVLKEILTEVRNLRDGQARIETRLGTVDQRLGNVEKGQLRLETRIENEIVDKIRALFDDRSIHMDYFASIKNSLTKIEDQVEFLGRQNIEHLTKLQEHDRELRLLRLEKTT